VSQLDSISVRFYPPPEALRRFFTTFYVTDVVAPAGVAIEDALQPEWANLRFFDRTGPDYWIEVDARLTAARFIATGPSSHRARFSMGSCRLWGIGLLPLGWAQFVGEPAADHANLVADGLAHPSFTSFAPLAHSLFEPGLDEAEQLARIVAFFTDRPLKSLVDEARILAVHAALIDPAVGSVTELVEQVGESQRTIERVCNKVFGFPPKLLLRRQRFMRSLAQFMLDPSLKWIGAMDGHYHDQAQFVRDFHEFMRTTPREYAAQPHPVLETFMRERARIAGAPVQTMDRPAGVGPQDSVTGIAGNRRAP